MIYYQSSTYPIMIKRCRIVFLALSKAARAFVLVENVRWKLAAFSNATIIAQHYCYLTKKSLLIYWKTINEVSSYWSTWLSSTKNYFSSQIHSLLSHSIAHHQFFLFSLNYFLSSSYSRQEMKKVIKETFFLLLLSHSMLN